MQSVYDCRSELKTVLRSDLSAAQLLKKLQKAGREYLITEGKVWIPSNFLLRSPDSKSYRSAALATLELPQALYYQAEMAAIVKARKEKRF